MVELEPEDDRAARSGEGERPRGRVGAAHPHAARGRRFAREPESGSSVVVRLLATPERIKRELRADSHDPELGLLRALWRVVRRRASTTEPRCDLDGLPPGFGGAARRSRCSRRSSRAQFLTWDATRRRHARRRTRRHRSRVSARLGRDRASASRRSRKARRHAAVRVHDRLPRGFVLRYFGDEAAAERCGGCDNCLGTSRREGAPPVNRSAPASRARCSAFRGSGSQRSRRGEPSLTRRARWCWTAPARGSSRSLKALSELASRVKNRFRLTSCSPTARWPSWRRASRERRRALLEVRGVGPTRSDKYGDRFLAAIKGADETEAA